MFDEMFLFSCVAIALAVVGVTGASFAADCCSKMNQLTDSEKSEGFEPDSGACPNPFRERLPYFFLWRLNPNANSSPRSSKSWSAFKLNKS